jgi:hypothetical protein
MTYELWIEAEEGPPFFEAITCADEVELLSAVQDMIASRGLRAVEVRRFGTTLFTITD